MTTKQILRVAYLVVALAVLMWIGIGGAIWSAWRTHQETAADQAAGAAATIAATPTPPSDAPFDRTRSSVQYERLDAQADPSQVPQWLAREIGPIAPNARSMGGWMALLRKEGVQVCWKSVSRRSGESDFTFVLPMERASVREVLDQLCRCDARYRWEWMKESEVVNLLADDELDVPLGDVSFRPKRLYHCLSDLSPYVQGGLWSPADQPQNYRNLYFWPVEMKANEITVRDYLNLAVEQYDGMTWTVESLGLLTLEAPQATRDAVAAKHRDDMEP